MLNSKNKMGAVRIERRTFGTSMNKGIKQSPVQFFDRSGPKGYVSGIFDGGYFFGNERIFVGKGIEMGTGRVVMRRPRLSVNVSTTTREAAQVGVVQTGEGSAGLLTHRRRQFLRRREQEEETQRNKNGAAPTLESAAAIIPPDASALLSNHSATLPKQSVKRTCLAFLALTKPRLTFLVVLSAAASYALFPVDPLLSSVSTSSDSIAAPSLSTLTLLYLTLGTSLCSASANTLNMYMEPKYDGQMTRTRNRPLVRGLLSGRQAIIFAIVTGVTGTASLYFGVNPTVSVLGSSNIVLYAGIYTPLKRVSVVNTWIGAIVGGIPPLMGWAAAAGGAATSGSHNSTLWDQSKQLLSHPGGWLLSALLFAWQFPHFNALSYTIREEYKNAGYRMLAWVNPSLNARVALRYSLLCFPICFGLTMVGVTDKGFLVTSTLANIWLARESWKFWREGGGKGTARGLFWASVWHLPAVMVLAMVHKSGLWSGMWRSLMGEEEVDADVEAEEEYYDS